MLRLLLQIECVGSFHLHSVGELERTDASFDGGLTWTLGKTFALRDDLFRSAVVTAAMAPGFNSYIFANLYGRAKRVAASSVLISTALSFLTAWGWLTILG